MAAPTFVGIRSSGWVAIAPSVDLTALAVAANDLIVACLSGTGMNAATGPAGFAVAGALGSDHTNTGNMYSVVYYKAAAGGEGIVTVSGLPGSGPFDLQVAVYRGLTRPAIVAAAKLVSDFTPTPTNPSITPPAGVPTVIVGWEANNPNYAATPPAGYTNRGYDDGGSTPRTIASINDRLVDPSSGSYAGSWGPSGGGDNCWIIHNLAFQSGVGGSFPGEPGGGVW